MKESEPGAALRIAHVVTLRTVGGIERLFAGLLRAADGGMAIEHHTVLTKSRMAASLRSDVRLGSRSIHVLDKLGPVKLLRSQRSLRRWNKRRILRQIDPHAVVLWNKVRHLDDGILDAGYPVIYYDHGSSWLTPADARMAERIARAAGVICVSRASRAMVRSAWSPRIDPRVCPNPVLPECAPGQPEVRKLDPSRPVRLGFAGRLVPVKGAPLALHAAGLLNRSGLACELWIAGAGDERRSLERLARELGISQRVRFLGLVADMANFYRSIDCLLCPSLRESSGLACVEAIAHGCPIVAAEVDGLPEVLGDGECGICVAPTLPISAYARFAGRVEGLPERSYDPRSGRCLDAPRLVDPGAVADAVAELLRSPSGYQRMSAAGIRRARELFDFVRYSRELLSQVRELAGRHAS